VTALPPDDARRLLIALTALSFALAARALDVESVDAPDEMLGIEEAARALHTSVDSLHRKWKKLNFCFKDPIDNRLKFSRSGIEKYQRARTGRR
jgi:hypothetical protein